MQICGRHTKALFTPLVQKSLGAACCSLNGSVRRSSTSTRQWSTPLAKNIAEAIQVSIVRLKVYRQHLTVLQLKGPISIANYMRQCLTSPESGYYTRHVEGRDQFGEKGDFITGPEISQMFGELVGIWILAEWMSQKESSSKVHIIEVGPGRGTLMDDMLRVCLLCYVHNHTRLQLIGVGPK
jgi:NADH dehydrogenase [ubiquinone] 1 alpha subcomplex assembly factor 7